MENKTKLETALDELLSGKTTEEIVGPNGLLKQLTKALVERAMNAELSHHLGYEKHSAEGRGSGNNRNDKSRKKVQGDFGAVEIEVPRDRNGTYDPKIIPKHERRFAGFDQKILSMYARGMTTREDRKSTRLNSSHSQISYAVFCLTKITTPRLTDFKVRVVNVQEGTAAKVRTIIDSADHDASATWSTVGVSTNMIEASCHALVDTV